MIDNEGRRATDRRRLPYHASPCHVRVRYQNIFAEHRAALRRSVRQLRAVLRLPAGPARDRQLAFARDAVEHEKASVRIWAGKVPEALTRVAAAAARAPVDGPARFLPDAAE